MGRHPPESTRPDTLLPYTPLVRSRFPWAHLVGPDPREIFKHRRFERIGIIPLVEDRARDRLHSAALARHGVDGGKAPTPRNDLELAFCTVGTNEQRNQQDRKSTRLNSSH